jgi:D-beta-D-heptose 7-phosphate kinase/D-beta-D-heptose 1-phosphate adenosyltransferase
MPAMANANGKGNGRLTPDARAPHVLVVGDVMLDHTLVGQARRLSPEAPVPVLTIDEELYGLGGAANVAHNLAALGASVRLAGVVGMDEAGRRLRDLCAAAGIDASALFIDAGRRTTVKRRFVAGTQQLLRVDHETAQQLAGESERRICERLADGAADAVIISDYAKRAVTPAIIAAAIRSARRQGAPCVVDPKGTDFARYRGCTAITPNADEAAAATGRDVRDDVSAALAGQAIRTAVGCEAVMITRGRHGVTAVTATDVWHLPAHAHAVFDVTGAGDTFAAALTLGMAGGRPLLEAVHSANVAAGMAVQRRGAAVVTREQLSRELAAARAPAPAAYEERMAS